MNEKKVKIVSTGQYSDYQVLAVFTEEDKIVDFVKNYNENINDIYDYKARIEEVPLNPLIASFTWYCVRMHYDGTVIEYNKVFEQLNDQIPYSDIGVFYVQTEDFNTAIKVANERRIQLIANNKWWLKRLMYVLYGFDGEIKEKGNQVYNGATNKTKDISVRDTYDMTGLRVWYNLDILDTKKRRVERLKKHLNWMIQKEKKSKMIPDIPLFIKGLIEV